MNGLEPPAAQPAKWAGHRNLRKRPAKPALDRGRLQRAARRAFIAEGDKLSTTAILDWAYVRRRHAPLSPGLYHALHRALASIGAKRIGRAETVGRPWLWRLRAETLSDAHN